MHVVPVGHAIPQPPQFALSVVGFTQVPPQVTSGALHAQTPAVQVWFAPHIVVQLPQCALLACTSTHAPPQNAMPMPQFESGRFMSGCTFVSVGAPPMSTGDPPSCGPVSGRGPMSTLFGPVSPPGEPSDPVMVMSGLEQPAPMTAARTSTHPSERERLSSMGHPPIPCQCLTRRRWFRE
jgi:hypothetical protein